MVRPPLLPCVVLVSLALTSCSSSSAKSDGASKPHPSPPVQEWTLIRDVPGPFGDVLAIAISPSLETTHGFVRTVVLRVDGGPAPSIGATCGTVVDAGDQRVLSFRDPAIEIAPLAENWGGVKSREDVAVRFETRAAGAP